MLEGHAERKTQFDKISRGKRNHDLLVSGTTEAGPLVVGVEGKADETFDRTVDQYAKAVRSPESEAPERLRSLTQALFGTTPEQDPTLGTLRYQLLSALAGTLADAKTYDAADAVLLVHEFVTPKTDDRNHEKNAADLEAFVGRLFPAGTPRERLGESWITGPTTIVSTGEWFPNEISLYVAKLVTHAGR